LLALSVESDFRQMTLHHLWHAGILSVSTGSDHSVRQRKGETMPRRTDDYHGGGSGWRFSWRIDRLQKLHELGQAVGLTEDS